MSEAGAPQVPSHKASGGQRRALLPGTPPVTQGHAGKGRHRACCRRGGGHWCPALSRPSAATRESCFHPDGQEAGLGCVCGHELGSVGLRGVGLPRPPGPGTHGVPVPA